MCDCLGNNDIYFYGIMDDSLLTKAMLNLIYRVLIFGRLVCHIAKVGRTSHLQFDSCSNVDSG